METTFLTIDVDGEEIFKKELSIVNIYNEDNYIHHGWNTYVSADDIFSAECNEELNPEAFIKLTDSNGIEYDVVLGMAEINKPDENGGQDMSNEIIIKDGNRTYFIEDTYE